MTKTSHKIIGITTAYMFGLPIIPAFIACTLPDIDTKWMKGNSLLTAHRGITHHVFLIVLLTVFAFVLRNTLFTSFALGYISHLFADMLTISGIPYWTNKERIALKLFKTGSIAEYIFVLMFVSIVVFVFTFKHSIYIPVDAYLIKQIFWHFYHNINVIINLF